MSARALLVYCGLLMSVSAFAVDITLPSFGAMVDALDTAVETLIPGLSEEAAWPTLRAHLLLLGAAGENPVEALRAAPAALLETVV